MLCGSLRVRRSSPTLPESTTLAKHRKARRTAAAPAFFAGATAAISTALALGHATNATAATIPTADTVIGVGGWRNPTSDRIPNKFEGELVQPGETFVGVQYPAELPVDPSVAAGQKPLGDAVDAASGSVLIVGYSEGSLVAERYKRGLVASGAPNTDDVAFMFIAAPFVPNGGVYSRFPGLRLPGFTSTGAAAPSPYDETFVTLEYDLIGDFPAYANPLSLANALAGLVYVHGDQGPDNVDLETAPKAVKVVTSEAGGTDTYILVRAEHLPLLQPIRDLAAATGTTVVVEPFVGAVEPTLRLLVDMGYTDRDYQNADKPTRFSLITPPDRIIETAAAMKKVAPKAVAPDEKPAEQSEPEPQKADEPESKPSVKRNTLLRNVFGGPKGKHRADTTPAAEPEPSRQDSATNDPADNGTTGTDSDTSTDEKDQPAA
ncbi:PE-PPE domain-containing protein [Mycolicibacterium monacense DSM 44395]|uniref:PE-PPE-like protein n=2 Tax=unclassified Mycobacterium TaxID=2642494 RepID=A0A5Q5BRE5_MYCSS|nr:PE-PPE [Mycolicibacterium monacense DSM 44395]OBF55832.1 PE-PPE domain-containing protein [Mycolicibacterium monacense]ORB17908.1 PE-PPE domain-containing protein [Mycolicibacterium monacense DSM 44395]QHP88657.1 PE-PPE domain-containing protein [Mycolicibacterium monacense DSM 44395]